MFACTMETGMALGVPDVCKTPPVGEPVPYPNEAEMPLAEPTAEKVLVVGTPALNLSSTVPITLGDTTGVMGGVASETVMADMKFSEGSEKVRLEGSPAVRLTTPTTHNNENTIGVVIEPSQEKVMILS